MIVRYTHRSTGLAGGSAGRQEVVELLARIASLPEAVSRALAPWAEELRSHTAVEAVGPRRTEALLRIDTLLAVSRRELRTLKDVGGG